MLVKHERNDFQKRVGQHLKALFPFNTRAQFEIDAFILRSANMNTCCNDMSARVEHREFFIAEKVTSTEIRRRLKAVYGDDAVDRSTINRIKLRGRESGKTTIVDEKLQNNNHLKKKKIVCVLARSSSLRDRFSGARDIGKFFSKETLTNISDVEFVVLSPVQTILPRRPKVQYVVKNLKEY